MPVDLVNELMMWCATTEKMKPALPFKSGDQITVTSGPFVGIVAEIESIATDKRVWVLMDIMGRQARLAVRPEQFRESY